ncbi:MAG: hypothetical protein ACI9CD_001038 [Candidatus Deianiraeaceae bacterium]|jgi:hypothetical protein
MSRVARFLKYTLHSIIAIGVLVLTFDVLKRNFTENKQSQDIQINNYESDISTMQRDIKQQSQDISQLLAFITEINTSDIQNDKYSKFLSSFINLHHLLLTNYQITLDAELQTIKHFTKNDIKLFSLFDPITIQKVYGIKYFEKNFGSITRAVLSHNIQPEDSKTQVFLKKYIFPHFAYISPNSSHQSHILYEAQLHLQNNNIENFYNTLITIDSQNEDFKKYLNDAKDFVDVWSAMKKAKQHINKMLLTEKQISITE